MEYEKAWSMKGDVVQKWECDKVMEYEKGMEHEKGMAYETISEQAFE